MRWRKLLLAAAASTAALLGTSANAASLLKLDVNRVAVQAKDAMGSDSAFGGLTHTGSLVASWVGGQSNLKVEIDSTVFSLGTGWSVTGFSVVLDLVGGNVTGGSYFIEVTKGMDVNSFTASLFDDNGATGNISGPFGQGFNVNAGIGSGMFSHSTFGGIDVSAFDDAEPLYGSLIEFFYNPDGSGFDGDVDVDAIILIPVPPAYGLGLAGLLGVAVLRRRRNKVA